MSHIQMKNKRLFIISNQLKMETMTNISNGFMATNVVCCYGLNICTLPFLC